jgi:hypothetical protein
MTWVVLLVDGMVAHWEALRVGRKVVMLAGSKEYRWVER